MHDIVGSRDQSTVGNVSMSHVLTSWKEIAAYIGKSVRTVQRWEAELGLPIRRPNPGDRNVVAALPQELDSWVLRKLTPRATAIDNCSPQLERMQKLVTSMVLETARTRERTSDLLERIKQSAGRAAERKKVWSMTNDRPRHDI